MNIPNLADIIALTWFLTCWIGYTYYSRNKSIKRPSLTNSLDLFRSDWLRQAVVYRENRVADTGVIGNLERNSAFFASSCLLILAGLLTSLGYTEKIIDVFSTLPISSSKDIWVWELKTLVLLVLFVYAFFKFTWSMRNYGFLSIMVGSAPHPDDSRVTPRAREALAINAGKICTHAGDAFNLGLRTFYYALAVLGWFVHPIIFVFSSTLVVYVLYRREFKSEAMKTLRSGKVFEDITNFKEEE